MQVFETEVLVGEDGTTMVHVPSTVVPGRHRLIVVVADDSDPLHGRKRPKLDLPVISIPDWPKGLRVTREDLYDDGRI